jgi:hypothetical protein
MPGAHGFRVADGELGLDAARVALFYAYRRDWQPPTREILIRVAQELWAEAEAVSLLQHPRAA